MEVAFITPEVLPYSKTGGLADVSLSLPAELEQNGATCTVFSPLHRQASELLATTGQRLREVRLPGELWIGRDSWPVRALVADGLSPRQVFIENDHYFDRPHPYLGPDGQDYPDNVARFSFFNRAVLEFCRHTGLTPDIFHCNDWQTALIPVYLKASYQSDALRHARTVLTIHNLGYQGLFPAEQIYATGLDWDLFTPEVLEFYGSINLLKGGIAFCDALTTVSPTYAREIQTVEYGNGLDGLLASHGAKLTGILNGIDSRVWNPASDTHLPASYTARNISGKKTCRKLLQREMGLPLRANSMLLGVISRLDRQKGIDLIAAAFQRVAALDIQLVVLGSGDPVLEQQLTDLAAAYPEQAAVRIGYDEPLAHRIIAGIDAFLMPSRYEPCGLTQLYSQAYGTVPIVRRTGGLADTVVDYNPRRLSSGKASGFSFPEAEADQLEKSIKRAANLFFTDHRSWDKLMRQMMQLDRSWQASAEKYHDLYRKLARSAPAVTGKQHV